MDGLGDRLRQRARELGLTDSEVARRLGLSQARYANYVNDKREPDFRTFLEICRILAVSPGRLFGLGEQPAGLAEPVSGFAWTPPTEAETLRERIGAAAQAMNEATLKTAATVMDALVRQQSEE